MVSRSPWSSLVLLGAISCGGASHSSQQASGGAGESAGGLTGVGGGSGNTGGKLGGNGGLSAAGSGPIAGLAASGMLDGSGAGTGGTSAGTPGACLARDIDILSVPLSGTIRIVDTSPGDFGTVTLSNGSDTVQLGTTATASASYLVRVIPGTYDVIYTGKGNGPHTLKSGVTVASSGNTVLDIDVPRETIIAPRPGEEPSNAPTITLSGKLTIDGQRPAITQGLILSVRKLGKDAWVEFTSTTSNGYSGRIAPGSYDLSVVSPSGNTLLPGWSYTQILSRGIVVPNTDPTQLDIDVRTAAISGTLTFDGVAAPSSCNVTLHSTNVGDFSFALDSAGAFSGRILPETYDVVYRRSSNASSCPMNNNSTIKRGLVVPAEGLTGLSIDIPTVAVSGKLTLGGAQLSNSSDDGTLSLHTDGGDRVSLGNLSAGTFSSRVLPGTYEIYFDVTNQAAATLAPLNRGGKLKSVVLAPGAPITLDIDVPSTVVTGTIKIAGAFLDKEYDGGRLWLGDPKGSSALPLGWTSAGKYSARVLAGSYDLYYQGTSPSALAPLNAAAKLGCFQVP